MGATGCSVCSLRTAAAILCRGGFRSAEKAKNALSSGSSVFPPLRKSGFTRLKTKLVRFGRAGAAHWKWSWFRGSHVERLFV